MSLKRSDLKKFLSPYVIKIVLSSVVFILMSMLALFFLCCLSLLNPSNNVYYCLGFTFIVFFTLLTCTYIAFLVIHVYTAKHLVDLIKEVQLNKTRKLELIGLTGEDLEALMSLEEYSVLDSITYDQLNSLENDLDDKLTLLNNSNVYPISFYKNVFKEIFGWRSKLSFLIYFVSLGTNLLWFYLSDEASYTYIMCMFFLALATLVMIYYNVNRIIILLSKNRKLSVFGSLYNRFGETSDGENSEENIDNEGKETADSKFNEDSGDVETTDSE